MYIFTNFTSDCTLFERPDYVLSNILNLPDWKLFTLENSGIYTCATKYHKDQFVTIGGWDQGAHGKVDRWGTNHSFLFPPSYDFRNKKARRLTKYLTSSQLRLEGCAP